MSRVYWDSMISIYWLENHPLYAPQVQSLLERMTVRGDSLCTSVFALAETLVAAHKKRNEEQAARIKEFFNSPEVELLPFSAATAERYAQIRSQLRVTPADAIHLASAAVAGVDLFVTNDKALHKLNLPGIQFITGLDLKLS